MTFDNVNVNANELFGVKVSFGNEIRRASCNDYSYAALCELVAKLFGIDPTASSLLIKYQDVDGDNITMSSDAEVRDAVQLAKEAKKTLRLIVEVKAKAKEVPAEPVAPPAECPPESESDGSQSETAGWGMGGFGHRWPHHGPRGGRGFHHRGWGGFPHHGPHHGFPHHGPHHGFPHHGFGPNGFPHRGFGPHGFPHPGPGEFPCAPGASRGGPTAQGSEVPPPFAFRFGTPCVFGHGVFSPAPEAGTTAAGNEDWKKRREDWDAMRKAWKSRKCAMKETLRAMKESASTPEDKLAIKEFKATMKAECKSAWKECKDLKRSEKENKKSKNKEEHRLLCKHVADVTIPDNSELTPDTPVVKTWKLKNAGNVEWPAGSQLLFISKKGDNLNGPEKVVLEHAVLPQAEVEVSVPFITPSAPGRYIGYYRMATPDFVKFGPRMWVAFVIAGTANATTTTVPTAPPAHHHLYPHLHPLSPHSPHHAHPHGGRGQGGQGDAMVQ